MQNVNMATNGKCKCRLNPTGVRPQLTFVFIVSHECRAYEIVKWELNKFILCDRSAFEQEFTGLFVEAIGCEIGHF